jgi:hypothetical protein
MASKHIGALASESLGQIQRPGRSGPLLTSTQDMNSSSWHDVRNRGGTAHEPPPTEGERRDVSLLVDFHL